MRSSTPAALAALIAVAGCDPTYPDFMAGRAEKVTKMKNRLNVVDDSIAAAGPVLPTAACATPPGALTLNSFAHPGNVEVHLLRTMAALVGGTTPAPSTEKMDVMLQAIGGADPGVATALQWAQHPPDAIKKTKILLKEQQAVDASLDLSYLMVLAPRAATAGDQPVDVYLAELGTGKLLCSFRVEGKIDPPKVEAKVEPEKATHGKHGKHDHHGKHDRHGKHGKHGKHDEEAAPAVAAPAPVFGSDIVASTRAALIDAIGKKLGFKL